MLSNAILLFLIIDPFGLIPPVIAQLKGVPPERRTWVLVRELIIALGVLVLFLFLGQQLLDLLHVSGAALSLAGAIILFLIALPMVFPTVRLSFEVEDAGEPLVVPLAIPLIAGPSALAMVMIMGSGAGVWHEWLGAVGLAWAGASVILLGAERLSDRLGKRALIAMERLMGMLLVVIAVQMFLSGLEVYLGSLEPV